LEKASREGPEERFKLLLRKGVRRIEWDGRKKGGR